MSLVKVAIPTHYADKPSYFYTLLLGAYSVTAHANNTHYTLALASPDGGLNIHATVEYCDEIYFIPYLEALAACNQSLVDEPPAIPVYIGEDGLLHFYSDAARYDYADRFPSTDPEKGVDKPTCPG